MISFECDYSEGAHEAIIQRLIETNLVSVPGYGSDEYCESAKDKIRKAVGKEDAEIFFLFGGTQTNQLAIDTMLQPYEGVVSVQTGHINVHEAGAIEFTGHKVFALPAHEGKMDAGELETFLAAFYADENREHMVFPGMVYISHPTEYGTLYSKEELTALKKVVDAYHIPLYMDGARLGYGLMSYQSDLTLKDVAELTDAFYIGGTKVGALCGEALVFTHGNMPKHFLTRVKQHGALMAKGRLVGLQFDTLFTDDLYLKISRHAIDMADYLKKGIIERGYKLLLESPTNQQFVILDNAKMEELKKNVSFSYWEPYDENHTVVRFATSWSTTKEKIDALFSFL